MSGNYKAPVGEWDFLLNDMLGVAAYSSDIPALEDGEMLTAMIEAAGEFAVKELASLNASGDKEGVKFSDGKVTLPKGFVDAWKKYQAGGLPSLSGPEEYGGDDFPNIIDTALAEFVNATNLSWGMLPILNRGAVRLLNAYGNDALKTTYLEKIVTGEWGATMAMTEANAGSDLSQTSTKAIKQEDGTYQVTGQKVFISFGDHDATDNIVHMVLAKVEGSDKLSLFLVPKKLVSEDLSLGESNNVTAFSIEEKMGLHGSPTCSMAYDGATGYLVGEEEKGLQQMFTMMNEARLHVGLQAVGLLDAMYQEALTYAKTREQFGPIVQHTSLREELLNIRASAEGGRALAAMIALNVDLEKHCEDHTTKENAGKFVALLTPVLKAHLTNLAVENASRAVQILGGSGYTEDYITAQLLRDSAVTTDL